jgi:hypothetical protein
MSAAVTATSDTIVVAPAVPILTRRYNSVSPTVVRYDVTPDGNRFLIVNLPTAGPTTLSLVLNWDVEVREKLRGNRTSAP